MAARARGVLYLDSSALVKTVVAAPESAALRRCCGAIACASPAGSRARKWSGPFDTSGPGRRRVPARSCSGSISCGSTTRCSTPPGRSTGACCVRSTRSTSQRRSRWPRSSKRWSRTTRGWRPPRGGSVSEWPRPRRRRGPPPPAPSPAGRQRHPHLEPHAPLAVEHELPAERAHALADADEARAAGRLRAVAGYQADAVVLDLQADLAAHRREADADAAGARVARDVGERPLRDAVAGGLDLGGQARREAVARQAGRDLVALAERAEQRVERRHEAEGVQHRGAEELREGAHGGERARHEPPGLGG